MTEKIDTKELEAAILKLNDLHPFWGLDAELKAIFEPLIKHARAHLEAAPVLDELIEARKKTYDGEWEAWGTGCVYVGNKCIIRKGKYFEDGGGYTDEVDFITTAANALQKLIERKG